VVCARVAKLTHFVTAALHIRPDSGYIVSMHARPNAAAANPLRLALPVSDREVEFMRLADDIRLSYFHF